MSVSQNQQYQQPGASWNGLRKGARTALIVQGVLSLIMGLVFLFLPFESLWVLSIFFGAWILVTGITTAISHFTRDREHRSGWALFSSIVSVIAGVIVLILPGTAAVAIVYIMSFWAILLGILYSVSSFQVRKMGAGYWWGVLIAGILAVVLGIVMLFNPGAALLGLVWMIGIYAIVDGVSEILLGIRMKKAQG